MTNHRRLLLAALSTLPLALLPSIARAHAPARVIVSPVSQDQRDAVMRETGATPVTGVPLLSVPAGPSSAVTARHLLSVEGVAWAEPDATYRASGSDPRRPSQWAMSAIHAERGWALAGLGRLPSLAGPMVAIVDTGADISHDDLRGRIRACAASFSGRVREGVCDDRDGHGTHTAGIAAAATGNGVGIAGVAASSPLLICRALGPDGGGSGADVAACIGWAAKRGAKVISLSLGGPDTRALRTAVAAASGAGAVIVAAAGNEGTTETSFPAGYPEVVSVAATDRAGRRAGFSNVNRDVEIAAPGVDILSTWPGNCYRSMSGTSMATPHVAGAAALLWEGIGGRDPSAVRAALRRSVREAGARGRDREYGYGVLDLSAMPL